MTTLEETTLSKVSEIVNPVRRYTVDDWMKVAFPAIRGNILDDGTKMIQVFKLLSRFEEMTCGKWVIPEVGSWAEDWSDKSMDVYDEKYKDGKPDKKWQPALLKKEHFVCEVEKPKVENLGDRHEPFYDTDKDKKDAYQAAQDQLIFEGFEIGQIGKYTIGTDKWIFTHGSPLGDSIFFGYYHVKNPTVYDFIIELDRFNRTASEPIKINLHKSFIKKLIA